MDTNYIIETKNLTKQYGSQKSVADLNIHVKRGRIYGLLGRNGAGKTTTMKMLLGLTKPTSGEVKIWGKSLQGNEKKLLPRIGSLIESPGFYPNLTGTENLRIFATLRGVPNNHAIKDALDLVGLPYKDKKLFSQYSLGMKQRLAIALAVMHDPELLILDEPTNGLDPAGIHEIRELIVKLAKEEGLTVFISSHILSEIEQIADRVGIINHGCLVYEGEIREIKSNTWIEIGGDFSQNNIVQHLVDFGSVRVREASASEVKLDDMSNDRLADIITYITDLGFRIFRVTRESETLEDIFLELTKEV